MINDITIGQFFPGKSIIHRLDPRVKLILVVYLIVIMFLASNFYSVALIAGVVALIIALSGISPKMYFKGLKAIWIIVIFTAVLNMFYIDGKVLWELGPIKITVEGICQSIFIAIRLICLILTSSVLTFTTSPTELTDAIERLLSPIGIFGKGAKEKVHELAMIMTIALRFVPTLIEETQRIMDAQKARGGDFENGKLIEKVKALIPILIPLFISAIRRALELATAMECRCYHGGENRTRLKMLKTSKVDYIAIIFTVAVTVGIIFLNSSFGSILAR